MRELGRKLMGPSKSLARVRWVTVGGKEKVGEGGGKPYTWMTTRLALGGMGACPSRTTFCGIIVVAGPDAILTRQHETQEGEEKS